MIKDSYNITPYFIKNNHTVVNVRTGKEFMLDNANVDGIKEVSYKENEGKIVDVISLIDEYDFHARNMKEQSSYAAVLRKLWRGKSSQMEIEAVSKYLKSTYRFYKNRETSIYKTKSGR